MERSREARRAANGGGLSRRRQRNGGYRDSPDEDAVGMETGRLRNKKDRSGWSKRRRGERTAHASSVDEGVNSSSDSTNEEDDEVDAAAPSTGVPPSVPHHHHRRGFPMTAKARSAAAWKAAEEMIGVTVPRRARTSSAKRPHEFSGGGGELFHRQASTSPARPSTPVSPSSSTASVRKKMKPANGTKQRTPKATKPSSVSEDLEIEVAEVLFGLTRQFQPRSKKETDKLDPKNSIGSNHHKVRSAVAPQPAASQPSALPPSMRSDTGSASSIAAPKRKRPRPVGKSDKESLLALPSSPASSVAKIVSEPPLKTETSSPRSDKNISSSAAENGTTECDHGVSSTATALTNNIQKDSRKQEKASIPDLAVNPEGAVTPAKESLLVNLDVNLDRIPAAKCANADESSREVKFCIDLMVPPPGKSSPASEGLRDYVADQKAQFIDVEKVARADLLVKGEEVKVEKIVKEEAGEVKLEAKKVENSGAKGSGLKKQIDKDRPLDLQLNYDKQDKDYLVSSKHQAPMQQQMATKIEPMPEIAAQSVSLPMSIVGGWPGSFPPVGYTSPSLQPVVPMVGSSGLSKTPPGLLSSQPRLKRCVTHCSLAQKIQCHQHLSRMNPFWPAATGAAPPVYGGKHNLNALPSSESAIPGNPLEGSFPAGTLEAVKNKGGPSMVTHMSNSSRDKFLEGNTSTEPARKKQLVLQQAPTPVSAASMPSSPAFVFTLNQQQAAAAAAAAPAARSGAYRSNPGAGSAVPSSSSASSAVVGSVTGGREATMSFNYPGLPSNEAQYMAILQNGAYPFPIPAHIGAPPPYRGNSAQTMPFFHGSFYPSQMFYPQQLQQPPHPLSSHSHLQQGHPKTSTSSSSSTSQKPPQQSEHAQDGTAVAKGSSYSFPTSKHQQPHQLQQHLPTQCETGSGENPSTPSSRVPLAQKSIYSPNVHPQNFTSISQTAATFGSGGGTRSENQEQPPQHQSTKVELTASQAFAMSFASFGGAVSATAPLQGLDFTSAAQNHPLFKNLPETARHGYQTSMAAAGATLAAEYKKPRQETSDDARSAGDSMNINGTSEERKRMTAGRSPARVPQNSLTFSRPDMDPPIPNILGSSVAECLSRTLNLIQAPANGGRVSSRPVSAAPATSNCATTSTSALKSQTQPQFHQQQHLNNFQKQQQQMLQQQQMMHQQQQLLNRTKTSAAKSTPTVYSEHLSAGSTLTNFPQALAGFPQAFFQGSGTSQPSQWKTCTRAATPSPAASPATPSAKNQPSQQQGRNTQQSILTPGHQTQISFGANSSKTAAPTGQAQHAVGSRNPTLPSAPSDVVGSPQRSGSKNASDSPRSSSSAKAGQSQATLSPLQQQKPAKKSPSNSQHKSSPLSNSGISSIHGQLQTTPAPNMSSKTQQQRQHQTQPQKQQQFPQAQFFFSNAYMPTVTSQSNGGLSAGYHHQRRQSEQPPQQQIQQNKTPGSMKIPSLQEQQIQFNAMMAQSAEASRKCQAPQNQTAGATKMPSLQEQKVQFAAMMAQSAGAAAAASAFPYMHALPSVKPAEQKPAAGNDNLHASWQPEKK